jgi:hypothetical protein
MNITELGIMIEVAGNEEREEGYRKQSYLSVSPGGLHRDKKNKFHTNNLTFL